MIKNEFQYRLTKGQLNKFQSHLKALKMKKNTIDSILYNAKIDSLNSQILDLENEIEDYEQLKNSKTPPMITLQSIEDIPRTIIRARIALGLTQKELGELIGVKEQQIQRWEANDYSTTSITRIKEVINALNLKMPKEIKYDKINVNNFFKKMNNIGLSKKFILNRLLPTTLASRIRDSNQIPDLLAIQGASFIGKIFKWKPENVLNNLHLQYDISLIPNLCYKLPKGRNKLWLNAYTIYAHYIATILEKGTRHLNQKILIKEPYEIHRKILELYNSLELEELVRYFWEMGIPVIALDDPGAFNAACFRINNRNIIVLKQKTLSEARWMFDLLHEYWHAMKNVENIYIFQKDVKNYLIENEDKIASQFAAAVLMGKNPQIVAEKCIRDAKNGVQYLKRAIQSVAQNENIRTDVLAYYIAFRLSSEGNINIWGIAENLQRKIQQNPKMLINNIIFEYTDLANLSKPDLQLLQRAFL